MANQEESTAVTEPIEDHTLSERISRRTLLKATASTLGLAVISSSMQTMGQATGTVAKSSAISAEKFMSASKCLIQHELSPDVGARMVAILSARIPTLDADLDAIIGTARERNSTVVEDFFEALPDGHVKDSAHQIIFGWYAGVVDESPSAEVFAYEEALMYQPTKDAVALPTYSFNGPDHWTDVDPPLSAMPEF
jgi:fructose 5-dehydrogenase small subunit